MWITHSLASMFNFSQVSAGWHFPVFHWKRSDVLDPALVLATGQNSQYGQQQSGSWGNAVSLTAASGWGECISWGYFWLNTRRVQGILICVWRFRWWQGMRPISLFFLSCVFCLKLLWADQGYARSHGLTSQKCDRCAICFKFRNCSGNWY